MKWDLRSNGDFTLRPFYETLQGSSSISFPWKAIWRVKTPRRVSFFVRTAGWGEILTCDK